MPTIVELMKPYLEGVFPPASAYADDGKANLKVTLPRLAGFTYQKSATLVFDQDVVDAVVAAHALDDTKPAEKVGNYIADQLSQKFAAWDENNVTIKFHVGSEALDK